MPVRKIRIFLASSSELATDRREFELHLGRKNKHWIDKEVFFDLVIWEDFLDAMSRTRLQSEYNQAIANCDIFVMLYFTKVGPYTTEEFEAAFRSFQSTMKPFIFTYFKQPDMASRSQAADDSLHTFQERLRALGHYQTVYRNIDQLMLHFDRQLEKLDSTGFLELTPEVAEAPGSAAPSYHATLHGSGAIAQGTGAKAVGRGGVLIGGDNSAPVNTGTQTRVDTGGGAFVGGNVTIGTGDFVGRDKITTGAAHGELAALFASLMAAVTQEASSEKQREAMQHVRGLEAEAAKGPKAEDGKIAKMIEGLVALVPGAVGTVVKTFANPVLGGLAGPVTRYVLEKLGVR